MDYVGSIQQIAKRYLCVADAAAPKLSALLEKSWTRRPMDRPIYPSAPVFGVLDIDGNGSSDAADGALIYHYLGGPAEDPRTYRR